MEVAHRIKTKNVNDNKIIEVDLSYISIEDQLIIIEKVDSILKNNTSTVYFSIDCTKSSYNWDTTVAWKNVVTKYEFVQYRAGIYGANWVRRLLIKFINLTNPHSVAVFKTSKQSEKHLLENM